MRSLLPNNSFLYHFLTTIKGKPVLEIFWEGIFTNFGETNNKKSLRVFKLEGWDKKGNVRIDEEYCGFKPNRGSGGFFIFFPPMLTMLKEIEKKT